MTSSTDLKRQLQANNITGLAIDIDETLSYTLKYWVKEMMRLFGNPEKLTAEEIIAKYRYAQRVPYWQSPEAEQWRINAVYDNQLQTRLDVIPGADTYIHELVKSKPIVVYLTIRPEEVISGTETWLNMHHFPAAPVIARPSSVLHGDGNAWKAGILEDLFPEVEGLIDDNYEVLKFLPESYPGKFFLFNMPEYSATGHKVYCCPAWQDVVKQVKSNF